MNTPVKGIREKSADTKIIENRLTNTKEGDVVTYDELSTLLGRDVREFCYGNLQTARKSLIVEGIFFDVVQGEGLKRLTHEEATHATADNYTKRARSAARTGMRHLSRVNYDSLSDEAKRKHLASSAVLGAMEMFSRGSSQKKIEARVQSGTPIAIGETLSLFTHKT